MITGGEGAAQPPEPSVVESIEVTATGERAEIRIVSSTELDLVGVRVDQEEVLSLQLPFHLPGPAVMEGVPGAGLVDGVHCATRSTSRGPLTRIEIRVRQAVAHHLSAEGRVIRLRLWPRGGEPEEAVLRRQVEDLQAALTASEQTREELARRLEASEQTREELAQQLEVAEAGDRDAAPPLLETLRELTEGLENLGAEAERLAAELQQAGGRESELAERITQLEAELAESERIRARLADQLDRQARAAEPPPTPEPAPTVRLGNVSPEGLVASPDEPSAPEPRPLAAPGFRFVAVASMPAGPAAKALASRLRDKGYASEVYRTDGGLFVVTLGRLPTEEARALRDEAVRRGDVWKDAYLIRGTSLLRPVDP